MRGGGLGPNDIKIYFITEVDEVSKAKWVKFIIFRKMNRTGKDPICIFLGPHTTFEDVNEGVCKAFGVPQIDLEKFRTKFTDKVTQYGLLKKCYIKLSSTQNALKMGSSTTYDTISFGNEPIDLENQDIFENTEFSEIKQETSVNKGDTLIQNLRSNLKPNEEMTQEYSWPENKVRLELLSDKKIVCWQAVDNLSYGQGAKYLKETETGQKALKIINDFGEREEEAKNIRNMPSKEELHARYIEWRDSQGYRY